MISTVTKKTPSNTASILSLQTSTSQFVEIDTRTTAAQSVVSSPLQDTFHSIILEETIHPTSNILLEIVTTTTTSIPSSTSTSMPQENTIIFVAVVPVSVILFIAISIIIVAAIIWRRRSYKSSHNIAKHPVSTKLMMKLNYSKMIDMCYAKASFDDDNKQQQYVQYKRVCICIDLTTELMFMSMLRLIKNKMM